MDVFCMVVIYFFFFKQKTAYEMRISDWSSDVCSSDLFGYLGTFTADRNVLMITPEGGKITRTPSLKHSAKRRNAVFTLEENGSANIQLETRFTGAFFFDRLELEHATPRRADEMLNKLYPLSSLQVLDWKIDHPDKDVNRKSVV